MEESTEKLINEALAGIINTAAELKEFAADQIPDILQQLLNWKMTESLIYAALGVFLGIITAKSAFFTMKLWDLESKKDWTHRSEGKLILFSVGTPVVGLWSILLISKLTIAIQIWIAPKVYLIEYAARLYK
jgi:Na+-transporting NADH:ubiquinone oxidoreductase subunit NqrE